MVILTTCDNIHRLADALFIALEDLLYTIEINLQEDESKRKEHEGHDSERITSCQEAELDGDRCGDFSQHPVGRDSLLRQKDPQEKAVGKNSKGKTIKEEECEEGDTQANSSFGQAVKPIDGTKPPDPSKDTSPTEKGEDQNHPPLKRPKRGKKRHFLKKGSGLFVLVLLSQFCGPMTASIMESHSATEPAMAADLPSACTDAGSQPDDYWLDRKEVEAMKVGSVFDGSDKGYRYICPNAFHGLRLREIILSNSLLTELPDHLFENVQELGRVILDRNLFTSIPAALNEYQGIEFIDISKNDIKKIPRGDLSNVTSLQGLNISGNKNLGQYPPDVFFLPHLRLVDVSNTAISSPPHPPCLSSEMSYTYSIKCSENHVELKSGSLKLTFYFGNVSTLYVNWNLQVENCSKPEGMQFLSDCKTSTPEPVENESSTDSITSVNTKSSVHPGVSDDSSSVKNDNKAMVGHILVNFGVTLFCGVSLLLKFLHCGYYVMVGLWLILLALLLGTISVALVYFGIWAALPSLALEITVIVFLAFDFKGFLNEFLSSCMKG